MTTKLKRHEAVVSKKLYDQLKQVYVQRGEYAERMRQEREAKERELVAALEESAKWQQRAVQLLEIMLDAWRATT